ncbi:MAG: DUF4105 domain-containing protein [Nitrospirota bacterium]
MRPFGKGYGCPRKSISFFFLFFLVYLPSTWSEKITTLNELLIKAEEQRLYDDRVWHILLHYRPTPHGVKSLIDDPKYFLSPEGKENPRAELEATLRAFFEHENTGDSHPKCRFIARYEWLKMKLNIDEAIFSDIMCKDFNEIMNNIVQPKSLVLVFPTFFLNNPASMFGHTLLRIDSTYQSKLLAHAANYGAYVDDSGILYPFKGIFGLYKGFYKVTPYYNKVKEYNDIEQRDMWEYYLKFSEEEVKRVFTHLWELRDIYSYYYFFDENCSYNLLFLLEAARPSLKLTENAGLWVIPVDTLRIVKESGIVEKILFRPALVTRIRYLASQLDREYQKKALKIVEGETVPAQIIYDDNISTIKKVSIFDLAIETIQYKFNKQNLTKDEYLKIFLPVLMARSSLPALETDLEVPRPPAPEKGHFSSRFSAGLGMRGDRPFFELRYRPAYHSLIDPDSGYVEGSQIVFVDTVIRMYSQNNLKLFAVDLLDIISLSPRDTFFKPFSWKFKTGLTNKICRDKNEHLIYYLDTGLGITYKNESLGLYYLLTEISLNLGRRLKDNYALGIGIGIGTIRTITNFWKINLLAEFLSYELGEKFQEKKITAIQTVRIDQNNSFNLSIKWSDLFHNEQTEVTVNWNHYF